VFSALCDQLASLDTHVQLMCCFTAVAELLVGDRDQPLPLLVQIVFVLPSGHAATPRLSMASQLISSITVSSIIQRSEQHAATNDIVSAIMRETQLDLKQPRKNVCCLLLLLVRCRC